MLGHLNIAAIIPALDEELNIAAVVQQIKSTLGPDQRPLVDHIIVCDNGSQDATARLATDAGAQVVQEPNKGYGAACLKGIDRILHLPEQPNVILFIDADQSVDCSQIESLLSPIQQGADLVIGTRHIDYQEPGALSAPQQFGNKLATFLIRLLWGQDVTDLGPFRAIKNTVLQRLNMQDRSFGWTVEMQVKAIILDFKTVEVPVSCLRRKGTSKISGTFAGVIGAGHGILTTIFKLWFNSRSISQHLRS